MRSARLIGEVGAWIGPLLLVGVGVWIATGPLREGRRDAERMAKRAGTWGGLVTLSFALAIDNVVVGFSLGLGDVDALRTAAAIAVVAVVFSLIGLHLGRASRRTWEVAASVSAGVVLVAVGVAGAVAF